VGDVADDEREVEPMRSTDQPGPVRPMESIQVERPARLSEEELLSRITGKPMRPRKDRDPNAPLSVYELQQRLADPNPRPRPRVNRAGIHEVWGQRTRAALHQEREQDYDHD
jgi:hypothetical protein